MRKFTKIGATALAMALSITMIAPISANAEVTWTREKAGEGLYNYNYTYTNEDTNQSLSEKEYIGSLSSALQTERKAFYIGTNSYTENMGFSTTVDVAKFENFKSNKKALKVKVISKEEYTDPATEKEPQYDYWAKDGSAYYYKNVNGEIVKVDKDKKDTDLPKGESYGKYTVRFFTKKAGTYKVTYDAILKNGTTVKKSITIIARDDGNAIKSVTFAGKVLDQSDDLKEAPKNPIWTKGSGYNTTTAKKGKIKVTMNKDFKLKKIEVGSYNIETTTDSEGNVTIKYKDEVNSLDDYCSWKTVKNGKTIKLSKVDNSALEDGSKTYNSKYTTFQSKGTMTLTKIRVTYYDKKNKTTRRETFNIYKVQK